jgi:hypothetical protein
MSGIMTKRGYILVSVLENNVNMIVNISYMWSTVNNVNVNKGDKVSSFLWYFWTRREVKKVQQPVPPKVALLREPVPRSITDILYLFRLLFSWEKLLYCFSYKDVQKSGIILLQGKC